MASEEHLLKELDRAECRRRKIEYPETVMSEFELEKAIEKKLKQEGR